MGTSSGTKARAAHAALFMTRLSKNIRFFAKFPDIIHEFIIKMHFILIFFENYLHISKKYSNFAAFYYGSKTIQK
jgi:hypothetical protein